MRKLLSLPPNLSDCFHDVTGLSREEWLCDHDPIGHKLGSGGATAWLLHREAETYGGGRVEADSDRAHHLSTGRRIILHAGGHSRRLPAYAPSGKILTPIPVFRWERGQRLSQDLLSLQIPLCERLMAAAPASLTTLVASGDVLVRCTRPLPPIPAADVVCLGLWLGAETAKDHGVFVIRRDAPQRLETMLQKPSVARLNALLSDHYYLTDIGLWLLSDRAVRLLTERVESVGANYDCARAYDLYSDFGGALGHAPQVKDAELNALSVAIVPLAGGEFYHFGTSRELISSTLAIQNIVNDQREIIHLSRKPHPAMFVQNALTHVTITHDNRNLWIENSCVGSRWTLAHDNIITGVPENDWQVTLQPGQCVDIVPVGDDEWAVRPYGIDDAFRGALTDETTLYLGQPFGQWATARGIDPATIDGSDDIQSARLFPVCHRLADIEPLLRFMLGDASEEGRSGQRKADPGRDEGRALWQESRRISADDIAAEADLERLTRQRAAFRAANWSALARNYEHSVFYQTDLCDAAREFALYGIDEPAPIAPRAPLLTQMHDSMFRSELALRTGRPWQADSELAFARLREGLTDAALSERQQPRLSVCRDQIVWGRSPARIDIAGGWTDTPPYCLMEGGTVVNLAIELNGQPPLQVYVRPCDEPKIILRSIDIGATEEVTTYAELSDYTHVGSPFSIPKAALALCGFLPAFCTGQYPSLKQQLEAFGCGIELTSLSAIPAGSGLGTSSILASTTLGALNDFCGLGWDKIETGRRTLALEQLLTTGGGWQDQYGGLLQGVKLLTTGRGFDQSPVARYLPGDLFSRPEHAACHLLYYTGITRTAKTILTQIVRRMFLNEGRQLALLREMKDNALHMAEAIQLADFSSMGRLVRRTWQQNQLIDSGTNPPEVQHLTSLIDDLTLGYKLAGAGGGGYLYIVAKDPEAAARIRQTLDNHRPNAGARFVAMTLSDAGLQVSRS